MPSSRRPDGEPLVSGPHGSRSHAHAFLFYGPLPQCPTSYPPAPRVTPACDRLLHALLPAPCLGCGRPLPSPGDGPRALHASAARGSVPPAASLRRLRPAAVRPALPEGCRCAACREHPPAFDRLLALWSYEAAPRRRDTGVSSSAGWTIWAAIWPRRSRTRWARSSRVSTGSSPCPSTGAAGSPAATTRRSRSPAPSPAALGLPWSLRSPPAAPPRRRASLGREERHANLRSAFRVPVPAAGPRAPHLLVDDVATTGATLDAAAPPSKSAGRRPFIALVAGRTPLIRSIDPASGADGLKRRPQIVLARLPDHDVVAGRANVGHAAASPQLPGPGHAPRAPRRPPSRPR